MAEGRGECSQFYLIRAAGSVHVVKSDNTLHSVESAIQLKRIAFAAQPNDILYGIGSDLKVYVWLSEPDVPIRKTMEVYENQRWTPTRGYTDSLLPTDRYRFSDESGRIERGKDEAQLPSANWSWESSRWVIHENFGGVLLGPEGWTYAVDFPSTYYPEKHWNHMVRRRRWVRTCRYRSTGRWVQLSWTDLSDVSLTFIDLAAGGCDLYSDRSCDIYLWSVTVDGQVFLRRNCTFQTAFHGDRWERVEALDGTEVSQVSCGAGGHVWVVTATGSSMARHGITRDSPQGSHWDMVGPPSSATVFVQIAVAAESVWGVAQDRSIWFRQGLKPTSPSGTSWVKIDNFSAVCITVNRNGEVFALNSVDNLVYWRTGVSVEDPHGKRWKVVICTKVQAEGAGDNLGDPWIWLNATAGFLDSQALSWDDGEEWKEEILDKLGGRFDREMKNFANFERLVMQEEIDDTGVLEVWSNKVSKWEKCKLTLTQATDDLTDPSLIVDGETMKIKIPVRDFTGISEFYDTTGTNELWIFIAFLTRARIPLRFTGLKSEMETWNSLLSDAYWESLSMKTLPKSDAAWILSPTTGCPMVSHGTSFSQLPAMKWITVKGHFRSIESASGLTWALGRDCSAWVWTGSYKGKSGSERKVQVDSHLVEVYENQRWNVLMGFCDAGFPTDRYMWSDETGRVSLTKDSFQLPSALWRWESDWEVDYKDTDSEGWKYAFDFPASFHPDKLMTDCVRRRRWFRLMKVETFGPWLPGFSTKLRSLSICPDVPSGSQISIWAVTMDGDVLVRDHVSTDSPQGDSWIAVRNPIPFIQICAGTFCVWAVASDGTAYVRNGTRDKLDGLYWFQVERPESGTCIREITVGGGVVWARGEDGTLFFRKNFSAAFPEGTEWVAVAENVVKISASVSDQLYAVVLLPGQDIPVLSRRTGVRFDNKIGAGWEYGIFATDVACRGLTEK